MLTEQIHSHFIKHFGEGGGLFRAPGRINLIGEHTDYNEGFVLPAAIDRYIYAEVKLNGLNEIRAYALDFEESATLDIQDQPKGHHWSNYILGVAAELSKAGYPVPGFDCVFGGNIPQGAGLSSSAALEVVFATALNALLQLDIPREKLALICQSAEHNYAGVPCGIMDQFASVFGQSGKALRLDCRSLEYVYFPIPKELKMILIDSGVKHELASSEYALRRKECEQGVEAISVRYPNVKSLRDAKLDMLESVSENLPEKTENRCRYVIEENTRLLNFCAALEQQNHTLAGELLLQTHKGLSELFQVSCPELDFLVEQAIKTGKVYGARLMGGGFGGCTLNLVHNDFDSLNREEINSNFYAQFGRYPEFIEVSVSDGADEITR